MIADSTYLNTHSHCVQTCNSLYGKRFVIGIHVGFDMRYTRVVKSVPARDFRAEPRRKSWKNVTVQGRVLTIHHLGRTIPLLTESTHWVAERLSP